MGKKSSPPPVITFILSHHLQPTPRCAVCRELWVLNSNMDIVSRGRTATMVTASGAATANNATDMIIDFENTNPASNGVRLDGSGMSAPATWTLDLGAVYTDLSRIVFWGDIVRKPAALSNIQ